MDARSAWTEWNLSSNRDDGLGPVQVAQGSLIEEWLQTNLTVDNPQILDVGCGTAWLENRLVRIGRVTATDYADKVVMQASERFADQPNVRFVAGDFLTTELGDRGSYDAVVTVETISHFEDQIGFLKRIADLLKPGGIFVIASQNRPVMERSIRHLPNPGWYRKWLDIDELRELVEREFQVMELRSVCPKFFDGPLHIVNSEKMEHLAAKLHLSGTLQRFKRWEEGRNMGFTLMCLARKKVAAQSA